MQLNLEELINNNAYSIITNIVTIATAIAVAQFRIKQLEARQQQDRDAVTAYIVKAETLHEKIEEASIYRDEKLEKEIKQNETKRVEDSKEISRIKGMLQSIDKKLDRLIEANV